MTDVHLLHVVRTVAALGQAGQCFPVVEDCQDGTWYQIFQWPAGVKVRDTDAKFCETASCELARYFLKEELKRYPPPDPLRRRFMINRHKKRYGRQSLSLPYVGPTEFSDDSDA